MTEPQTASSPTEPLTGKVEMEELKPCPFCGSNNVELEDISDTDDHQGYVICRNNACGAWPHNAEEIEVAVNQWNSRPIEDIQRERITALESSLSRAQERLKEIEHIAQSALRREEFSLADTLSDFTAIFGLAITHRLATEDKPEKGENKS